MNVISSSKRYKELDALRGIAALFVVFFHFTMDRPEATLGFKYGVTGVDLFFMISGFVILMSLEHVKNVKAFVTNRFSRLYPTYWTCVTIVFLLIVAKNSLSPEPSNTGILDYLANMTMFQHYLGVDDLDGPYWTMIVEMCFYGLMAILFWSRNLSAIHYAMIPLICCAAIAPYLLEDSLVEKLFYWFPLFPFISLFYAGILFYKILRQEENQKIVYWILIACTMVCQILLYKYGKTKSFVSWMEYSVMIFGYYSVFTLFVNGRLTWIINSTSLFFGKISYALYLIHQKISCNGIIPFIEEKTGSFWLGCIIALVVVIALATAITYLIEIPSNRKLREYFSSKKSPRLGA